MVVRLLSCGLRVLALPALGSLVVLTGCGASSTPSAPAAGAPSPAAASPPVATGTLTVFAAASLTGSFTQLGKDFEAAHPGVRVRFSFAASSALAQQILSGAPADVFASASAKTMMQVTGTKAAQAPRTFATNVAEIAVAPKAASKVHALADLDDPGLKVALCQAQVPCGALADTVLATAKVTVQPVTRGLDVKSTLAYVTSGEADAAIVYATDVLAAGSTVTGVEIPAAQNSSTAYPIATVTTSKNAALAGQFEDYVLSGPGQATLAKAGFSAP